jgi:hypothetical protein
MQNLSATMETHPELFQEVIGPLWPKPNKCVTRGNKGYELSVAR